MVQVNTTTNPSTVVVNPNSQTSGIDKKDLDKLPPALRAAILMLLLQNLEKSVGAQEQQAEIQLIREMPQIEQFKVVSEGDTTIVELVIKKGNETITQKMTISPYHMTMTENINGKTPDGKPINLSIKESIERYAYFFPFFFYGGESEMRGHIQVSGRIGNEGIEENENFSCFTSGGWLWGGGEYENMHSSLSETVTKYSKSGGIEEQTHIEESTNVWEDGWGDEESNSSFSETNTYYNNSGNISGQTHVQEYINTWVNNYFGEEWGSSYMQESGWSEGVQSQFLQDFGHHFLNGAVFFFNRMDFSRNFLFENYGYERNGFSIRDALAFRFLMNPAIAGVESIDPTAIAGFNPLTLAAVLMARAPHDEFWYNQGFDTNSVDIAKAVLSEVKSAAVEDIEQYELDVSNIQTKAKREEKKLLAMLKKAIEQLAEQKATAETGSGTSTATVATAGAGK